MRSSSAYNIPKRGTTSIAVSFIGESPGGGGVGVGGGRARIIMASSWLSNTPFKLEEFF